MTRGKLGFHIVYTLLAVNFFFPSLSYLLAPDVALGQMQQGLALAGLPPFPLEGEGGYIWRTLGGTNVLTLAFMCVLIQVDVRRFYPVLWPLVFLKGTTALAYLGQYLFALRHPLFLLIVFWDGLAVLLMIHFARRARDAA